MAWIIKTLLIALGVAAVVLLVKWLQRCPRCNSMVGPKGLKGWLMPNDGYKVKRMCRKCGHSWDEEGHYDTMAP